MTTKYTFTKYVAPEKLVRAIDYNTPMVVDQQAVEEDKKEKALREQLQQQAKPTVTPPVNRTLARWRSTALFDTKPSSPPPLQNTGSPAPSSPVPSSPTMVTLSDSPLEKNGVRKQTSSFDLNAIRKDSASIALEVPAPRPFVPKIEELAKKLSSQVNHTASINSLGSVPPVLPTKPPVVAAAASETTSSEATPEKIAKPFSKKLPIPPNSRFYKTDFAKQMTEKIKEGTDSM